MGRFFETQCTSIESTRHSKDDLRTGKTGRNSRELGVIYSCCSANHSQRKLEQLSNFNKFSQKYNNQKLVYFWATNFVKRFTLCYQTLSICNVAVLWPNGWMDQDETWHAGRPRPWLHCVGPAPPPLKGHSPPIFGQCPLWPSGWMY